jgi:hypothetical protein
MMKVNPYNQNGATQVEIQISPGRSIVLSPEAARTLAKDILRLLSQPPFKKSIFTSIRKALPVRKKPVPRPPSMTEILSDENDNTKVFGLLHERMHRKVVKSSYDSLTRVEKIIENIFWLQGEVANGGFDQFFFNSAADHTFDTIESLSMIGADHTRNLVIQACSVFPQGEVPANRSERQKLLMSIGNKGNQLLNTLDGAFYEFKDDLESMTVEYIKKNQEQIKD